MKRKKKTVLNLKFTLIRKNHELITVIKYVLKTFSTDRLSEYIVLVLTYKQSKNTNALLIFNLISKIAIVK